MKLEPIQNALFAAYDLRNAMSNAEKRKPTDNDTYVIITSLERIESEIEEAVNHYCEIFDTNHGELSNPSTPQD
jgi:hypothetical protein